MVDRYNVGGDFFGAIFLREESHDAKTCNTNHSFSTVLSLANPMIMDFWGFGVLGL